jgi:hypothetical protein
MTNARPQKETGAVMNMPGGQVQITAAPRRSRDDASPKRLHVELYRNTARLRGRAVRHLLKLAGVNVCMYDRALGCWTVPVTVVDDVMCVAEYRQRCFVTVEEVAK